MIIWKTDKRNKVKRKRGILQIFLMHLLQTIQCGVTGRRSFRTWWTKHKVLFFRVSAALAFFTPKMAKNILKEKTSYNLPACPLPCMLLSKGKMSAHFSRSTCPARQSSVTICRALWHRVMLSSARTLMSLLLSHCTPEEPGGRRFIWAPFYAPQTAGRRAASWSITSAQRMQRSDWPRRVPAIRVALSGVTESNPSAAPNSSAPRFGCESRWLLVVTRLLFLVMTGVLPVSDRRPVRVPVCHPTCAGL